LNEILKCSNKKKSLLKIIYLVYCITLFYARLMEVCIVTTISHHRCVSDFEKVHLNIYNFY